MPNFILLKNSPYEARLIFDASHVWTGLELKANHINLQLHPDDVQVLLDHFFQPAMDQGLAGPEINPGVFDHEGA